MFHLLYKSVLFLVFRTFCGFPQFHFVKSEGREKLRNGKNSPSEAMERLWNWFIYFFVCVKTIGCIKPHPSHRSFLGPHRADDFFGCIARNEISNNGEHHFTGSPGHVILHTNFMWQPNTVCRIMSHTSVIKNTLLPKKVWSPENWLVYFNKIYALIFFKNSLFWTSVLKINTVS